MSQAKIKAVPRTAPALRLVDRSAWICFKVLRCLRGLLASVFIQAESLNA